MRATGPSRVQPNLPHDGQIAQRLGDRLVELGVVTEAQIAKALEVQRRHSGFLGQILVDLGFTNSSAVGKILAQDFGVSYVNVLDLQPPPGVLELVTEELLRDANALPFRMRGDAIDVAMVDPVDVNAIDRIHMATRLRVRPYLTMATELVRALNRIYSGSSRTDEALEALQVEAAEVHDSRTARVDLTAASDAPIVRLVDSVVQTAIGMGASDIHFEPNSRGLRVRFRVDGSLVEHTEIPATQRASVTARMKVLCVMDITEARKPQDGRMRFESHGTSFDIRASSVPTPYGEKIVLRILDKAAVLVPLARLGFQPDDQRRFETMIQQPHGMVIVVGPTGSGKTTTLYASLNLLNDTVRNIMTLEDPIEYEVDGLNQVQVNSRLGLTFAAGLRTFVRQDPDVILVGEIRDRETAEMAVQASLTGHLLLSTLHTNSAVGTIARLVNLGVDPFLVGQALSGVVSQRLVARLCQHCAQVYSPDQDLLLSVGIDPARNRAVTLRRARGCKLCSYRGYSGRVGVYEIMTIDEDLQRLIRLQAPDLELQAAAERAGMKSLYERTLELVYDGTTSLEEMVRVVRTGEATTTAEPEDVAIAA